MAMKDLEVWTLLERCLGHGQRAVLMSVTESHGSSPGRRGFKMALPASGDFAGTIGGGVMEHRLIAKARQLMESGSSSVELSRQVHDNKAPADRSGMICAGEQRVAICPLGPRDLSTVKSIRECFVEQRAGGFALSPAGLSFCPEWLEDSAELDMRSEDGWSYREPIAVLNTVYIVGGGHVGLALSRVMATLDFRIVVFDHRPELETLGRNEHAHEIIVASYDELPKRVKQGKRSYAAIVSTNFKTDEASLRALIGLDLRYLGVMGSVAKIDHIKKAMLAEGVPATKLAVLHAPIGVDIASHTPEEIAISVAAQIIAVKNAGAKIEHTCA